MKQSALAVHLLVCGGDLMFPACSISLSPAASDFPFVLTVIAVCVYVHRPYECVTAVVCLFTFSLFSSFTRLRDLH